MTPSAHLLSSRAREATQGCSSHYCKFAFVCLSRHNVGTAAEEPQACPLRSCDKFRHSLPHPLHHYQDKVNSQSRWRCRQLSPALTRQRQKMDLCEFQSSLVYVLSSVTADIEQPCLKNTNPCSPKNSNKKSNDNKKMRGVVNFHCVIL